MIIQISFLQRDDNPDFNSYIVMIIQIFISYKEMIIQISTLK